MLIFIEEWRTVLQRQLDRLDDGHWSDAYLLIVASRHVHMGCAAFAEHDPTGGVTRICREFAADHAEMLLLRNVIDNSRVPDELRNDMRVPDRRDSQGRETIYGQCVSGGGLSQ
jgi:hypothetical protein